MKFLRQSTAANIMIGPAIDDTDFKTAETAVIADSDIELSKNGANFASKSDTTDSVSKGDGFHLAVLNATDTGTLGRLRLKVAVSGVLIFWEDYMVVPANVYDSLFSTDKLEVDLVQINGDAGDVTAFASAIDNDAGLIYSNLTEIDGSAQSVADLKDFADNGYDPVAHDVEVVKITLNNSDMRGTDSANTVVPDPAGTAPTAIEIRQEMDSNSVDLDAILTDVTGLNGDAMRGTDSAALASVCTEARLAELDAVNIPTDLVTIDNNVDKLMETLYVDGVYIDTVYGSAGTSSFVNGTILTPCDSVADAKVIADALGIKRFRVLGNSDITLPASDWTNGYVWNFENSESQMHLNSQTVDDMTINSAFIEGGTGATTAGKYLTTHRSVLQNVALPRGKYHDSYFEFGITLAETGVYEFVDFKDARGGGADAKLDFTSGVGAQTVIISGYTGNLTVKNMQAGDVLRFFGDGVVDFDNTNTGGTALVGGSISVTDGGGGVTITNSTANSEGGGDATLANQATILAGLAIVDGNVDDIETLLGTVDGKVDVIDGNVDDIETLLGTVDGKVDVIDGNVDDIETLLGTVDGKVDAVKVDTAAIKLKTDNLPHSIKKNTAIANFEFVMLDENTNNPVAGLTVIAEVSLDGVAFVAMTNSASEVGNGAYKINIHADDVNCDAGMFKFTAAGAEATMISFLTES